MRWQKALRTERRGVSDGTSDDGAGVVLQTLYGFSVAASSNIYSKGNFGFAPVLYR